MNSYSGLQESNGGRRLSGDNPDIFNGPNPLNVPIGENFIDFSKVPLPGVNA